MLLQTTINKRSNTKSWGKKINKVKKKRKLNKMSNLIFFSFRFLRKLQINYKTDLSIYLLIVLTLQLHICIIIISEPDYFSQSNFVGMMTEIQG